MNMVTRQERQVSTLFSLPLQEMHLHSEVIGEKLKLLPLSAKPSLAIGSKACPRDGSDFKNERKQRGFCRILKRMEVERDEKKVRNLTLEDWIIASPGLKPGEGSFSSKNFQKKVHPCVSQRRGSLLTETKDSLCLDRPMKHDEEGGEMLSSTSLNVKSERRVRFKLPHTVIYYSLDEPCSPEETYYSSQIDEGSFYSSICREYSFNSSAEEPFLRLAVDILPLVSVSSKI
ncbi:uncharacterized protein HKW66_Vig0018680 [Vigna angularis]|uniref:Uncharacterized protein n=1 Tax=Phaseolus angularis TaxID=3914 RepID=A0A8T0L546_PHAAN|nr:uncharacterized protein LOC128194987 isoform X1 [Vigna angularis]KAG2407046.1 uncharacterized protein HKW66_Vig0018680 [Vigna angularis]